MIPVKVIKTLPTGYPIPDPLPWSQIAGPLAAAEDAVARLDERLAKSPIRDGWIERTHYTDACASLWLEGELVHLEDLVLHDAHMDVRTPTHELTRARSVLRTRRRIADAKPEWALSAAGIAGLRGRGGRTHDGESERRTNDSVDSSANGAFVPDGGGEPGVIETDARLADAFAAVDAAIARADRTLADRRTPSAERDPLVYDLDWDEDSRLDAWQEVLDVSSEFPPTLAAAIAADAWDSIEPLQHMHWLGRLLAASLLRERRKARWHLPCLQEGLKAIPRERRHPRHVGERLAVQLSAIAAGADAGLKNHDRWLNARMLLARKLNGRRSTSRLPDLIDYVLSRPIVSAGMIAAELRITPRAAQDLVAELGLREATGRGRYRAWAIL